ncbi:complex I subunit 5 family protein [Xanthobacter agilis]|uniref:complex I subunit 5 family protein n=1 Tax=Xanthobacter agilis TaxID=47492 RepID=UPI00372C00A5
MAGLSASDLMLLAAVLVPLVLALAAIKPFVRRRADVLLLVAPLPGLLAAVAVPLGQSVLVVPPPFRLTFALDLPGAVLLGGAALLWLAAGAYAVCYLKSDPARGAFSVWWLLTLAGSFAVFLVADVASFYLAYALVSFSAFGLATHDDTAAARRAGRVYLALTVFGEALLIAAFVMLAAGVTEPNPLIRDAVAGLPASPWRGAILALLLVGFGMKMGLFPLHVWMPLAHAVAPVPGSAVLSGIVVKAGLIGLIRFLPAGTPWFDWGAGLLAAGLFTAFYGVAIGLTQRHPKRVLAYSTVSQMGVVAAVLGVGLKTGDATVPVLAAFYGFNHMLLKGAMFLTVGVAAACPRRRLVPVLVVAAVLGLSLAGLPFTGGALAKFAVKEPVGDGLAGLLLALSAVGTTVLMARYVLLLADVGAGATATGGSVAPGLRVPWAVLSAAAVGLPFALFTAVTGTSLALLFSLDTLIKGLWPVALGLGVAALIYQKPPKFVEVPAGDILVAAAPLARLYQHVRDGAVLLDTLLRRWSTAALALVLLALVLGYVMAGVAFPPHSAP